MLERDFPLGLGDFRYQDLHSEERLSELDAFFLSELDREDAALGARLRAYRSEPASFDALVLSLITTASWSGSATVCTDYQGTGVNEGEEKSPRLLHNENGVWVDRTSSLTSDGPPVPV